MGFLLGGRALLSSALRRRRRSMNRQAASFVHLRIEGLENLVLLNHKIGDHIHPILSIVMEGQKVTIPAHIGHLENSPDGARVYDPHTHDATGELHIGEDPTAGIDPPGSPPRLVTLKDFFDVWRTTFPGTPGNNPNAFFSKDQILDKRADATHVIKMTVNGQPNAQFENYSPHDKDQIVISYEKTAQPPPPPPSPYDGTLFAIGGAPGRVLVNRTTDGGTQVDFAPYGPGYQGTVSVAVGDVNGDGVQDVITGSTIGSPHVKVFDGKAIHAGTFNPAAPDNDVLASFMAFGVQFGVGVNVAVGHISGSKFADIAVAANRGNPHVKVISGQAIADGSFGTDPEAHTLASFFAYALNNNYGANVAVGDVTHAGFADVVCGATTGNPHVKVYSGESIAKRTFNNFNPDASLRTAFLAFGQGLDIGVDVAVGDTTGSGFGDIIAGALTGSSHVKVFSGKSIAEGTFQTAGPDANVMDQFFAYASGFATGVTVGAADFDKDGKAEILTGSATGSPHFRIVKANATGTMPPAIHEDVPSNLQGGISVGA